MDNPFVVSTPAPWPDTGVNIMIMQPGQPNCLNHREPVQETSCVHDRLAPTRRGALPVNEVAAKYSASVQTATDVPGEAYADWRTEARTEADDLGKRRA